ncbi:XRE family transcriptional regulator [Pseudooceanicola sp.]|uniref:XRE family transcriptional regulator n=1 Tax=Pseudooceanicola sp. TaxID=1914328 RepID=UPI00262EA123|nr:XRE family transcriptional regulator [Pseudooceanicola sp.]MDF1855173.1 XRE family transcriptional regulator [Pseudooceanicola sp.]
MDDLASRLAARLRSLRLERGLTLDALAGESGVSRGSLSRIETAETSPTAEVLGRLAAVYGLSTSRLMRLAEVDPAPLIRRADQEVWQDQVTGFTRRTVSPPAETLAGHVIESRLRPDAMVRYDRVPVPGMEHHLLLTEGALQLEVADTTHALGPGDCLRYRLDGPTSFHAGDSGATYLLFIL